MRHLTSRLLLPKQLQSGKPSLWKFEKTALHLLEYGYAWLYMNRSAVQNTRPEKWPQIKVMLSGLRRKVEALDSELLFSSSLTDAQALVDKLNKVDQLVQKIIEKFLAEPND
uniref:Four helix bundle protein n=1 Tax=Ditylenchus dipsaci TaxID=166011 RepID=A0A915ENJ1_9BILA